jgi:hypothetical protein
LNNTEVFLVIKRNKAAPEITRNPAINLRLKEIKMTARIRQSMEIIE